MAVIKNVDSGAASADAAADKAGKVKEVAAKSKGVHLLEGLLGRDDRLVIPITEGRNKIQTIKQEVTKKRGWMKSLRLRHAVIVASFFLMVAVPATLASFYMVFLAADQYHSSSSFSVRSISSVGSSDLLGMFTQATSSSTVSDSYILMDFVRSERMLEAVETKFDLEAIYAARGLDYFYGLASGLPVEDRVAFWRSMIDINFDHGSGIMQLQVKAFDPQQSQDIAKFVIEQSDALVNNLSAVARDGVLKSAQDEVLVAEVRLAQARVGVRQYRDQSQEVDPVEGAKLAAQLIGGLEAQLVQLNSDLTTARTQMSDDTPRIRVMKARIASIEEQIEAEKQRLGSGMDSTDGASSSDVAGRIQRFEALETQREFAERAYAASLISLEKARLDANNRQRYLAVFIEPTLSQMAQYPSRLLNSFLVTLGLLFAWSVLVMGYYNIRDRT
ncbi:RkpR, polysaccharide export protein [Pararhizobium antarcticum]|uniref:RkpR, polysaccharide export protein n=1 Tax=Pararhizobium antarcticum TaxID=1798805 RepID=A0A657LR24_9HYPH|nr:RkpR, polysaccharide export protein [Pararhizobium antarcticum]OJF95601.1 RkpR, polysaccharide export protein [Pararhizobium antarcticum]OJF99630.1 RkpR, polysaccharide export protein [Rhizobium sp. 58]